MSKCLLLLIGLCVFSPRILSAQHFPTAPVKIEVGAAAGGGMDIVARALAERLSPLLGQPVLVSNRAGAGGAIAMMALKNAQPDGYTLALVPSWTLSYQPLISTHYRAEDFTLWPYSIALRTRSLPEPMRHGTRCRRCSTRLVTNRKRYCSPLKAR